MTIRNKKKKISAVYLTETTIFYSNFFKTITYIYLYCYIIIMQFYQLINQNILQNVLLEY